MVSKPRVKIILGLLFTTIVLTIILLPKSPETPATENISTDVNLENEGYTVLGTSAGGLPISVHTFGSGDTDLLFVGGIHGGYEWNSVLLAEQLITYLEDNYEIIPKNISVHIIANLNPDGLLTALGTTTVSSADAALSVAPSVVPAGRFNANNVDLNRNFNCRWSPNGTWRGNSVNTGSGPFSEPEATALRDYVYEINPVATVFWHSQAGNVYGSECGNAVTKETLALMNTYAMAAGYGAVPIFDAYVVAGAAEDWLASLGIPTISVELETRTSSEFEENLAGITAVLDLYSE